MNSKLPVSCDKCGFTFDLFAVGIHEEMKHLPDGECRVVYSFCPNCKYISLVSIETEMFDRRQAEIDVLKGRLKKLQSKSLREDMRNKARLSAMVKVKMEKQKKEVDKLCEKYNGCFELKKVDGMQRLVFVPERLSGQMEVQDGQ